MAGDPFWMVAIENGINQFDAFAMLVLDDPEHLPLISFPGLLHEWRIEPIRDVRARSWP
jgi:hypothetical protein